MPHTSCNGYVTVRNQRIRAIHSCPLNANCFDTFSCRCRVCVMTTCPAGPSRDQIILNVYDNSDTVRGVQSYSRTRNPGLTAGFSISTDTQGNVNPIGLPARPVYRRPGSQPGETVFLNTPCRIS